MSTPQNLYSQSAGQVSSSDFLPVIEHRDPTLYDSHYPVGKRWINSTANSEWVMTSKSASGATITANWEATTSTGGGTAPISKYIVDADGSADYTTVQSAINAAHAAGTPATVYVRPGTYTENLTLYSTICVAGAIDANTTIIGVHTPPASGTFLFQNITLQSATDIFNSSAAGSAILTIEDCYINLTNGFVYNLPNWTGSLTMFNSGNAGTNDGFVNNTGGATIYAVSCDIGAGSGQTMVTSGSVDFEQCTFYCPSNYQTGTSFAIIASEFRNTLTFSNNSTGTITDCRFVTGTSSAITQSSSGTVTLSECSINTSNTNAIAGAGAGAVNLGNISFLNSSGIASTVTVSYKRTINRITPFIVGSTGNFSTVQAAVTACAAAGGGTVLVQPGTYTENLTLSSGVIIAGVIDGNTTITGVHTPPASGTFQFQNIGLTSATHIFSSAVAGSCAITVEDCYVTVTNGFLFNLANWTGALGVFDTGCLGTNDGFINNTGGSAITIVSTDIGAGTGQTMVTSGVMRVEQSTFFCPANFQTGTSFTIIASDFRNPLTLSNNSTGIIANSRFATGSSAAITMSSSGAVSVSETIINSSANPCIAGAGAGVLTLGSVTFINNSATAGTLTLAYGTVGTGTIKTSNSAITVASGTGEIDISADAAATTVKLGTGAGAKTVTVGSTNSTSATTVNSGTGGITLETGATAGNIAMTPATNSAAGTSLTLNGRLGQATFTGQTTASGSSQAFTITNSSVTGTTQAILVSADNLGSNDAQMTITRVLQAANTLTVTLKNNGAAALNGDVHITFHILN